MNQHPREHLIDKLIIKADEWNRYMSDMEALQDIIDTRIFIRHDIPVEDYQRRDGDFGLIEREEDSTHTPDTVKEGSYNK